MRLLNVDTFTFTDFLTVQPPSYAIASHRWLAGTEAMWEDVQRRKNTSKAGYRKVEGFAEYVKTRIPLVKWLWIDTCCIDQKSSQEVGEAINSMFRWYRDAEVCLAYLEDVTTMNGAASFEQSVWFKRGWTLQELLAPSVVIFLSQDWEIVGHKGHGGYGRSGMPVQTGVSMESRVAAITKIPEAILRDYGKSKGLSNDDKLRWMADRETTRGEDQSYCMLGILGVSMNIRYGDGRERTRIRLLEKVSKSKKLTAGMTQDKYRIPFSLRGIPFTDFFVPRETDMQHLTYFFKPNTTGRGQRVFVVHGMGGTGKTQLCAEFARTQQGQFSAVFWLDGSSRDALKRSLVSAALRLPGESSQQSTEAPSAGADSAQLSESFLQWLSLSDNQHWLLIIDNVDRDWQSGLEDAQAYDYSDSLPHADHGSIIVTTRLARLRRPNASLGLASVDDRVAREMVESRAGRQIQDVETLLLKLGGLPLALVQAGSYLRVTGMTAAEYISAYDKTWADLMRYQEQFPLQEYAERSVLTTWKMSYEQVKSVDALAAWLLDLWAFLYHGDVWLELVLADEEGEWPEDHPFPRMTRLPLQHSIGVLMQYSMVNAGTEGGAHSVHPVVHAWCLHNITTTAAKRKLLTTALRLVSAMAQEVSRSVTREVGLRLAAHAKAVSRRADVWQESEALASHYHGIAYFLQDWESSDEVESLYLQALRRYDEAWGAKHTSTLDTVNNLGNLYKSQGKMAEAEEMYVRALQGSEEACGAEHTSTLNTVNNLGILYKDQGKMVEAEKMYVRALQGMEEACGAEHTSTLHIVNNLANLYRDQGKMAEAEEMYVRALRGYEEARGGEHTSTLNTVNNLGSLYKNQGKMVEAEEMYVRALRGYEKALGAGHTSTLVTVHNLGLLYKTQGKMAEAEEMYMRALRGKEKALGAEHTSTLDTVNNLGNFYVDQGKMVEAEEMYVRALRGYEKALGTEHTSTLDTVNNASILYAKQGRMVEAEQMYMRALRGYEKAWGAEHTATLNTVNNLGNLYADQGKMAEAEEMFVRALHGKEKAWGAEHTSTLDTVINLGLLYFNQGKMVEAEAMYVRALQGFEKAWGAEHTSTLDTVNNLGNLYVNQGKMVEAEEMYVRALRGYENALGAEHTSTLETINNLGSLYKDQGKTVEAEEMYVRALRGKEKAWGAEQTSTLNTVHNFGLLYAEQGKVVEAEEMYVRALRGFEKAWGAEHTATLNTVNNLGGLYANRGKLVEAEQMYVRALGGFEKALGVEHTSTLNTVHNLGLLYAEQGRMVEAEEMYVRALRGYEKAWGAVHTSTLRTMNILGILYKNQGKMVEAEKMLTRALQGYRILQFPPQACVEALERKLASMHKSDDESASRPHAKVEIRNPSFRPSSRSSSSHGTVAGPPAQQKRWWNLTRRSRKQ